MSEDEKERLHEAWLNNEAPILLCKATMFGFGVNWQRCCKTIFVGMNDSFEQVYQGVRRFWRFGQTRPVDAHFIASEREGNVLQNQKRKEQDADRMAAAMVEHMADLSAMAIKGSVRDRPNYNPTLPMELPRWLTAA